MNPGSGWLAPADIAAIWRLPKGTVYWLAHHHQWRRRRAGRRTYYHSDDVDQTLIQQAAAENALRS